MDNDDVANLAAILEDNHDALNGLRYGDPLDSFGLDGYTVVSTGTFPGEPYTKAITVEDPNGNIIIHFYGTGDGNWGFNAAAYGAQPQPSEMQIWALDYFNETVQDHYEGQSLGSLYVTGHSQGGNSAQYVTVRSAYGDYIESCLTLDGPGFSYQFVDDTIALYGEAYYENQRNKIWAYNGENDFVSILGQVSIIPEGQTLYIRYTGEGLDFLLFHMAAGLLDENGKISLVEDDSEFRKLLVDSLNKVKDLPPEQQARAAELMMMLCEDLVGAEEPVKSNMTAQEFNELKQLLGPFLVQVLADCPDRIVDVLMELGMDQATAEAIQDLLEHINTYPPEVREQMIQALLDVIVYENGEFNIDKSKIPAAIITAWPIILETILTHPGDILTVLHELGVDAAIENWIKENPLQFVGICFALVLLSPLILTVLQLVVIIGVLADAVIRIVQGLTWLGSQVKEMLVQLFTALKNVIQAFAKWVQDLWNRAGRAYAAANPYFKVDTGKLRNYATRINNVNNRLRNLDVNMRGLYWQIGLLDLWDILAANLLTSGSPTLNQIKAYLNDAADRLETAENKARGYVGG